MVVGDRTRIHPRAPRGSVQAIEPAAEAAAPAVRRLASPRPVSDPLPFDLDACLAGDPDQWSRFVRFAAPLVLAVARRAARGAIGDSDDDAQEVFVRLVRDDFRLLRAFDSRRARIETYLAVITRSVVHERTRRRALPISRDAEPRTIEDPAVESAAARNGVLDETNSLPLEALSEQQRTVLLLMHRQGLTVEQIAKRLEIEPQTVRSAHHKAVVRLRALLGLDRPEARDSAAAPPPARGRRGDAGAA